MTGENIVKLCEWDDAATAEVVALEDFYAYMPLHAYLFAPSREMWPASQRQCAVDRSRSGQSQCVAGSAPRP